MRYDLLSKDTRLQWNKLDFRSADWTFFEFMVYKDLQLDRPSQVYQVFTRRIAAAGILLTS